MLNELISATIQIPDDERGDERLHGEAEFPTDAATIVGNTERHEHEARGEQRPQLRQFFTQSEDVWFGEGRRRRTGLVGQQHHRSDGEGNNHCECNRNSAAERRRLLVSLVTCAGTVDQSPLGRIPPHD
jgi:hypothetical protein